MCSTTQWEQIWFNANCSPFGPSVLKKVKYHEYQWVTCVDLKVINFLHGQQSSYIKYFCFLCLWDSTNKTPHQVRKKWTKRENLNVRLKTVINDPLREREEIIFALLHIRLGLRNKFVRIHDENGLYFTNIGDKCLSCVRKKLKQEHLTATK